MSRFEMEVNIDKLVDEMISARICQERTASTIAEMSDTIDKLTERVTYLTGLVTGAVSATGHLQQPREPQEQKI